MVFASGVEVTTIVGLVAALSFVCVACVVSDVISSISLKLEERTWFSSSGGGELQRVSTVTVVYW